MTMAADTQPSTQPIHAGPLTLHAGPIQLKFADGELRYLRVGDREIVRRIYLGVRDVNMGTEMPVFSQVQITPGDDHFAIHLAAACSGKSLQYDWSADITGSADGTIVFRVTGAAATDGTSRRIGLCVLYGVGALAGQKFEAIDKDGNVTPGQFPLLVAPALVGKQFNTLRYSADGLKVQCGVAESPFDMEDQRNYGDSSFKAYNPLPYPYPKIAKGSQLTQTLTLTVAGAAPTTQPQPETTAAHVRIGTPLAGAVFPAIGSRNTFGDATSFVSLNQHRQKWTNATAVTWSWTTATHLPDDDVAMENLPAIVDQAHTIRSLAPRALLRVGPISMNGRWPKIERPAGYAGAWTADALKYLALANVDEVAFAENGADAQQMIQLFQAFTGKPLLDVKVEPAFSDVDAFAAADIGTTVLWLVNRSDNAQHVVIDDAPPGHAQVIRLPTTGVPQALAADGIDLRPYEVCEITFSR
jgi:hypothetical protein